MPLPSSGRCSRGASATSSASTSPARTAAQSGHATSLRRLDRRRVWGTLALIDVAAATDARSRSSAPSRRRRSLADAWDAASPKLPPDWSDLLCELELDSSDHVPRAALLGAPLNPTRVPDAIALRFRASGKQGYGVSPEMARRCFERMDAEGITGRITVLRALSDTENADTQGPSGASPAAPSRLVANDLRGALHLVRACGSQRKRSVPVRASFTFQVCEPVKRERLRRAVVAGATRCALWIGERSRTTTVYVQASST